MCTGVAGRLGGEARKGCGLTMALWHWGCRLWCRRTRGGVAGPRPLEHDAQPHQGDQHQLVIKEMGDHGKIPSHRWSNEGIVPGFQTAGISRRLEVQDLFRASTGLDTYPAALQPAVRDGVLQYACNSEIRYRVRGI